MTGSESTGSPFDDVEGAAEGAHAETPESIADEIRHEIRLGHVHDDVSHVLEERFAEAGIDLRPEEVDDLAEEIERDAST
jgi:hypothetical protein